MKTKNPVKKLPPVGIEPGPLITSDSKSPLIISDSKSNTILSGLTRQVLLKRSFKLLFMHHLIFGLS